ncbi:hypothetical protein V5799_018898 [Amblyomma americanum]|uniref:Uncharacterized protein n=1 Tax=Amblyomma americanum TaxID=6943 RepID=A0AAQ4EYF8_AMBAM
MCHRSLLPTQNLQYSQHQQLLSRPRKHWSGGGQLGQLLDGGMSEVCSRSATAPRAEDERSPPLPGVEAQRRVEGCL